MRRILACGLVAGLALQPGLARAETAEAPKPGLDLMTELLSVIANDTPLPPHDPKSTASCTLDKGWMVVFIDFTVQLHRLRQAGRLENQTDISISTWVVQLQNYIIDTADVTGACESMIAARTAYGF